MDNELHAFLLAHSPAELESVRNLWDTYSGLPGLLDEEEFRYNSRSRTYRSTRTGRVVTEQQILAAIRRVSSQTSLLLRQKAQRLLSGTMTLPSWQQESRSLLKTLYRAIFLSFIGGILFDNTVKREQFYAAVLTQFQWHDNLVSQIAAKEVPVNGRLVTRSGMYGNWGSGLYQNLLLERARGLHRVARRVLGPNESHCRDGVHPGCVELAAMGFMPAGAMIPIGEASCLSNCKCTFVFR